MNYDGSWLIEAEGISELVKWKRFSFDSSLDTDIKPIDPNQTQLLPDNDSGYRKAKLFLEHILFSSYTYFPGKYFNLTGKEISSSEM